MSDSEGYEAVTVSEQGVTVTKRFEADEFPVPAIAFEFESTRDETVRLTLSDAVPEGVEVEDLGFHPEYGSEYWTIDEDEITFEREFPANSEYTTVYGIRATGTDDVERFLEAPSISAVDPPLSADGPADAVEAGQDVVRDVIKGENETPPGLETDEETDEDVEPLELNDPDSTGQPAETSATNAESSGGPEPTADSSGRSLVSALATELRNGNVAVEDVELLREALKIAGERGGSITARVDRIQEDVANLRAYTDALEDFLDEHGTAEEVVEDFRADVDDLTDSLAAVESTVDMNEDSLGSIEDDLSSLQSVVEDLESSVASLEADVDEVKAELGDDGVKRRVDEVEEDLEDLRSWQEQIKQTFGGE
jgi:outer membrane murein-binding lipoprotein Lpp